MSATSPVPPPAGPAGTRRGASRLGYWAGGGLVAAGCIGAAAWVPGESGRVGKAIASFQAAAAGDYHISAGPGTGAGGTVAIGGDVLWDVVPHIAGAAAVFLAGAAAGGALIIVTAVRRSGRRAASRDMP